MASNGRLQVEHAIQVMEAGCHVLSEVPGAYTEEECVRLRAAVERTGKVYMLGENTCYWDFFRYFRKWIAEDRFGPISIAEGEYLHYLPRTLIPAGRDDRHPQRGPRPGARGRPCPPGGPTSPRSST